MIHATGFDTAIGSFHASGVLKKVQAASLPGLRRLERYAIVYIAAGEGVYADTNGVRADVAAGSVLLLFPDVPHQYGPLRGQTWDEFYLVFSGPVFDLWRQQRLLSDSSPIGSAAPVADWFQRWMALVADIDGLDISAQLARICRLQELLGRIFGDSGTLVREPRWLAKARAELVAHGEREPSLTAIAELVGMSYESFRKRFTASVGVSPGHYRASAKVIAAEDLLATTDMTIKQIASALGFADEFHFAHRFKKLTGESPGAYRQRRRL
ncbi:MAG TPA: AraC family transcriptional regulator [Capsulimonadaceae bacterium]|jgi:AraC-like DNA-binding protein